MKARFGTKLFIVIIALILLVFGAATLYVGIRLNGIMLTPASQDIIKDVMTVEKATFNGEGYWTLRRIILLGMGCVEALSALFLLTVPGKLRYKKNEFIVQQTENGEIRIAVRAIENLVRKCTDMHEEIEVSGLRITNHRDGVAVDLKATMPNNISIPLAVDSLQKQIKQYITVSTGVSVREVRVAIVNTNADLKVASPYEVGKAESDEKPEKKAAHERVFEADPQPEPAPAEEAPAAVEAAAEPEAPAQEQPAQAETAEAGNEGEEPKEYTTSFQE